LAERGTAAVKRRTARRSAWWAATGPKARAAREAAPPAEPAPEPTPDDTGGTGAIADFKRALERRLAELGRDRSTLGGWYGPGSAARRYRAALRPGHKAASSRDALRRRPSFSCGRWPS